MAPRPLWKGYLKLSLVSCAVALYGAANNSEKVSLHILDRRTGNRVRRQLVDAESGDVVESDDQVRGYEIAKNEYVMLEDDELDAIALESTHTIEIDQFVPRRQIDEVYLDSPYYLTPSDEVGAEAFVVIRDAMRDQDVVGLAHVVLYRRERVVMLEPRGKGILATTLRYGSEVRDDRGYFDEIPKIDVPDEMVDLAAHIIKTKAGKFDPARFEDRYEDALVELIKAKQAGRAPKGPEPPKPSNVINLMDALRRSVAAGGRGKAAGGEKRGPRAKAKRAAGARSRRRAAAPRKSAPPARKAG
jgi:DNA end-binding protein Ku